MGTGDALRRPLGRRSMVALGFAASIAGWVVTEVVAALASPGDRVPLETAVGLALAWALIVPLGSVVLLLTGRRDLARGVWLSEIAAAALVVVLLTSVSQMGS